MKYYVATEEFMHHASNNNEAVEEELVNKLDALWYLMYRAGLAVVEIITLYLVAGKTILL